MKIKNYFLCFFVTSTTIQREQRFYFLYYGHAITNLFVFQVSGIYAQGRVNFPCSACLVGKDSVNLFDKNLELRTPRRMREIVEEIHQAGDGLQEKQKERKQKDVMQLHSAYPVNVSMMFYYQVYHLF